MKQLGTDANCRYKRSRISTTISGIHFIETFDKHRCEDVHFCRRSKMIRTNDRWNSLVQLLTAGINTVESSQQSHQLSSLKQLINTGVKKYTFVREARWWIPMIDAVQLDTDTNSRYKRSRMSTTISPIQFFGAVDKYRCEDVHFCRRIKMMDTNDRCSTAWYRY